MKKIKASTGLAIAALVVASASLNAQQEDGATVEEIVVQGRLKDESIQDIPASVIAMRGEELQDRGVFDIQVLQHSIPNFRYTTNVGPSDNLILRGIGTIGSGVQFEPGVGQQLNGVAFSRSRIGRAGLIDTAQVEVLRGPQGAVTGKNTSLGLVNIVPNKPTDEFEASIYSRYDFEDAEGLQLEAVISGPLGDRIRGRLAANYKDQDGWVDNINVGGTAQTKDDFTIRGILEFDVTDNSTFELFAQKVDAERDGKPREIVECTDAVLADPFIGNGDCTLDRRHSNEGVLEAFGATVFPERLNIDFEVLIATYSWDINDGMTFTSVTSKTDYLITDLVDTDLSPAGRLTLASSARRNFIITNAEDFSQFTQEFRLSGNFSDRTSYIAGILYSEYDIDFSINSSTEGFGPGPYRPSNRYNFGVQENEGYSAFFDMTHDISDRVRINAGLRYISEDRSAFAGQISTRTGTALEVSNSPAGGPGPNCLGRSGLFSCSMFPVAPAFLAGTILNVPAGLTPEDALFATGLVTGVDMNDVNDDDVTGNINIQFRPDDDDMYYVSAATGFKAGGFQMAGSLTQSALESNFSFGPEETVNIEIGGRHFREGEAGTTEFNWTLYSLDIEGQQVSSLDPIAAAQVIQADGKARSQGFEIDGKWRGNAGTVIGIDLTYTDAEYTNFTTGTCFRGQSEAQGCVGGVQDRTGTTLAQAPEVQGGIYLESDITLDSGYVVTPHIEVRYVDDHYADTELNPFSLVDSYTHVNARINLEPPSGDWSLSLVGSNLGDELHWGFFNESGSVPGNLGGQGAFAFPNIGRQLAVTFRYNFD